MILSALYQGSNARLAKPTCKNCSTCKNLQNLQQLLQVVNLLNINIINLKLAKLAKLASQKKSLSCVRAYTHVYTREKITIFFASFASFTYNLLIFKYITTCKYIF